MRARLSNVCRGASFCRARLCKRTRDTSTRRSWRTRARRRTCVSTSTRTAASAGFDSTGAPRPMPDFKDLDGPIEKLNRMSPDERRAALLACCGSERWAEEVAGLLPMWDVGQLLILGERVWRELGSEDWLGSFRAPPQIRQRRGRPRPGGETRPA